MGVRPTQSRKGVKGGFPLAGSRGGAPLWGLGQRPNCFTGDQLQGSPQQRRRQRSVPATNFALPQERPQAALPAACTLSRQMGATTLHDFRPWLVFSASRGFRLCGGDRGGNGNRRSLRSPPLTPSAPPLFGVIFGLALIVLGKFALS